MTFADQWVRGFRDVPHAQQDTTGACEGYHSAIKGNELAKKSRLQGRRVDWLLYLLWHEVCGRAIDSSPTCIWIIQVMSADKALLQFHKVPLHSLS